MSKKGQSANCPFNHILLLFLRHFDNILTHIRSESLRDTDRAVLVEVIFKESDKHSRRSNNSIAVKLMESVH